MKRLILLVLILIGIPVIVISSSSVAKPKRINYYSDLPKDDKWEYVKERLFEGETQNFHSRSGPILVKLINAHSKDSIALESVLDELSGVIPNKDFDYFKNYTGTELRAHQGDEPKEVKGYKFSKLKGNVITLWITEVESKKYAYTLNDERFLKTVGLNYYGSKVVDFQKESPGTDKSSFVPNSNQFTFKFHESQTIKERKEMMRFYLVRMLSCSRLFKERNNRDFEVVGAMLNSNEPSSWHLDFTEYDKFLLQKFYSPTLVQDYRNYISTTYPEWFAANFGNKEWTKVLGNWVRAILAVVLFFLTFSLLYKRQYRYKYLIYFVPIVIAYICRVEMNLVHHYFITKGNPINHEYFWSSSLVWFSSTVIIAFFLWLFDKYIIKGEMSFATQLVLKIGFTFFVFFVSAVLVPIMFSDIGVNKIYHINWNKSYNWFLAWDSPVSWAFFFSLGRGVLLYLNFFSENLIKQKDIELSNLKAINAQAEVKLLQSQINPHFLYNALNSIASLAQTDGAKTEKMALSLSDLFKYTINRKGKKNSTIGDEVEMVKNYLEVEQIRFGDRLSYQIDVDENLNKIEIPMFLIQPLIENAVKHGISNIEESGFIHLKISKSANNIIISVKDNGPEFSDGLVSGHGLQTVYDLLKLSYGDHAKVNMQNTPEKQVSITIKNIT